MTMIIQAMHTDSNPAQINPNTHNAQLSKSGVTKLSHLGVIRAAGDDAAKFLQGQLTNDFVLLSVNESRLAAYCSPKGRMLASFIGFKKSNEEILLICNLDILPATLKRLSMFVMRAKLKLIDATGNFDFYGLVGNTVDLIETNKTNTTDTGQFDAPTFIPLRPVFRQRRALLLVPAGGTPPAGELISSESWQWIEVQSGIAHISTPIIDAFVPQMLNYESVEGVNFKKGCYPGQEVVARSQFRGTLKRRAYVVQIDAANANPSVHPFVGQEVYHSSDAEQACGTVAQVAADPAGGFTAIVSMQISASESGNLTLDSSTGAALRLLSLPYTLLDDI